MSSSSYLHINLLVISGIPYFIRKFISALTLSLARAIKKASVNLITVPFLTTGSIAYP